MTWLPGWDSASDSGWWSHFWFWFGIVCLFALGASEVVSHFYGLRKDELIEIATRGANEHRQRDTEAAETRRKIEVEGLQKQLAEADKKAVTALQLQAPRRFSEQQKQTLIAALSPFRGQKILIQTILGDAECKQFLEVFVAVFDAAGWDHNGGAGITFGMFTGNDPVGVMILMNPGDVTNAPPAIAVLADILRDLGFVPPRRFFTDASIASWAIKLVIGRKPSEGFGYK